MLSGDIKTADITGSSNDNLCDSLALNFESTRVVVGTRRNSAAGQIKIYNYDPFDSGTGTANTWVLAQTITGSSSSTNFGQSTDMNYDGNRIVVGAPGENKVYVYDATSTSTNEWATYVSNTITGTSSSNFGWSVSLARDISTKLAIGSPSENKVYMYELSGSGSTWSQTWSNVATDVPNLVPLSATTDVCMTSNNASYGYSVDLAPFGRFLAIGAPGVLTTITSSNSTYTGGTTFKDIYYDIESIVYGATGTDTGNIYQRGYIRCFKTSNVASTWQNTTGGTGITSLEEVTQHGQLVYGSRVSNLNNFAGQNTSQSWSLPALGFSVAISVDGSKLVGGEPFYSPPGNQASIHKGNVRAWLYDSTPTSEKFQEITSSAATWFGDKFGYAVELDYDGGRMAVGSTKRWSGGSANEGEDHGGVHVFDFTSTAFYEVNQGNNDFEASEVSHVALAITNGTAVACGAKEYNSGTGGKVRFYHMILSQVILGNTVIGGYLAADSIFIGPNNNLADNSFTKRISFGGTYNDNKYEAAEIENKSYSTDLAHEGHSELFLVKKSVGSGGTGGRDMIRLKANEIQLHNYITRGHSTDDNKYDMFPRLTMSEEGNFKLNPEFLYGRKNSSTYSSCDVKALLDINGDTFCRGKLNAGHKNRSNTRGFDHEQGLIFYDTRDRDIINGTTVYSNVHMTELQRRFTTGTITGTVTYNDTESAFKLGTSSSRIYNAVGGYTHGHQGLKLACWIKLTKDHDQYSSSGETILAAGDLSGYHVKCQIYNGGVQLKWGSGYTLQESDTFTKDRWYHLFFYINQPNVAQASNNNYLWIDGASITWNSSGGSTATVSTPSWNHDPFYVGSTSDSIVDAYIGMVHARNTHNGESYILDATDLYTNGPPSERLSVGGDAYIEQKLGIANVVPMYPLDVTGDINFTGNLLHNGDQNLDLEPVYINKTQSTNNPPLKVSASTTENATTSNGILISQAGTAGQHAIMAIQVAGANSGNAFVSWDNNVTGWSMGIDNNDNDKLKIANNKDTLHADTHMEFSSSGTDFKKAILANGSAGTNGQVLTSSGGGTVSWEDSGGGGGSSLWTELSDGGTSHPTSGMTSSTSGNPQYQASASTYAGGYGHLGLGDAWRAFNGSIGNDGWHGASSRYSTTTGNYTGSDSTTYNGSSSVSGDWIELTTPSQSPPATGISMNEVQIAPRTGYLNRCAGDGMILGRYNGSSTYDLIHSFTGQTYTNGNYTSITFPSSNAYRYFRIVITKLSGSVGDDVVNISEIKFITSNSINRPGANVGIGIPSPSYKLDVNGDINISTGSFLRKNGNKIPEWTQTPSSTTDVYRLGKVGIGTSSPGSTLDVDGDINISTGSSFKINGVAQNFNAGSSLSGTDTFEWGAGVSGKHTNAGKIGYSFNRSGAGANDELDIIGAGTTTYGRYIRLYDKIGVGDNSASNTVPRTACINVRPYGHSNPDYNGLYIYTPTDTGAQDAIVACRTGGSGGGDPYISFDVKDQNGWCWGIDNSDDDKMKLGANWNSLANNTKMTIDRSGNVGIGTSSPEAQLHTYIGDHGESNVYIQAYSDSSGNRAALFFGTPHHNSTTSQPKCAIIADAVGWSRANLHFCIEGTANNGSSYRASTSNSRMMIDGISGRVGIGTTSPTQGKLVVSGSGSGVYDSSYGYLNSSGSTGTSSGTNYYGIYATNRIAGWEFNAHSDSRIKKNISDINDSSALDKIRLIEPKIYNYIDEKQRGTSNVYGFIAQQVANVLPYAVTVSTGDIPNILTNSNVSVTSDSNVLELRLDTTVEGLTLSNTSNINITIDNDQHLTVPVLTFSGSNVITIQNSDKFTNVTGAYIHGEQVSNFHHLNKDAIFTVATAALQEVDRQLQAEKTKVATLETQVANLLARVTALENA